MSTRREFLAGTMALAACGRTAPEDSEMPIRLPFGPNPLDPRQPRVMPVIPEKRVPRNPIYTQQPSVSPIHLSSSIVLTAGSSGAVSTAALKNPMGQDMELLEIKFEVSGADNGGQLIPYGGTIWCELVMGGYKLTGGAVPVWNFGRAENLAGESKSDSTDSLGFVSYSWRLPRPLFIPAGAVVAPKFIHTGFIQQSVNVRVGYSARTVTTKPKVIYMPWVAKYVSKSFNPVTAADVDTSTELDLVNPNPEVLHLQRFIGRTLFITADETTISEDLLQSFASRYLMVRMTDSYGRPIVRNYAPFRTVFGALTRSWEMDNGASLDPEAYYIVNLRKDALSGAAAGAMAQAFVSVVGWRELEKF